MIIVKNRQILFSNREQYIGTTYDNNSNNMVFRIDRINDDGIDLSNLTFKIDIEYSDTQTVDTADVDIDVTEDHVYLTWSITNSVLSHEGTHLIQIRAFEETATIKWSTFAAVIYIENALSSTPPTEAQLTELEQLEVKINEEIKKNAAAEAARIEAEAARVESENTREQAEQDRIVNEESRVTAEEQREQAELERSQSFIEKSLLAKSYAVGGTGIREGEDTDNAKYYKEHAEAVQIGSLRFDESLDRIYFGDAEYGPEGSDVSAITSLDKDTGIAYVHKLKDITARTNAANAAAVAQNAEATAQNAADVAQNATTEAQQASELANAANTAAGNAQETANKNAQDISGINTRLDNFKMDDALTGDLNELGPGPIIAKSNADLLGGRITADDVDNKVSKSDIMTIEQYNASSPKPDTTNKAAAFDDTYSVYQNLQDISSYTTDETECGEWLGQKLYKRLYRWNNVTVKHGVVLTLSTPISGNIIKTEAFMNGEVYLHFPFMNSSKPSFQLNYEVNKNYLTFIGTTSTDDIGGNTARYINLVVYYTK